MEGIVNFSLFLFSAMLLVISPGPDFMYVTTRAINEGKKAGVLAAFGITFGLLIHTLLAAFGLSAIVQASRAVYLTIKYLGAAYLLYIGVKTLLKKSDDDREISFGGKEQNVFTQGVLINVFNPKAMVTFMAFLPQFVRSDVAHPTGQLLFLGLTLVLGALTWFLLIGYFSGSIGSWVKKRKAVQKGIQYFSGSIMTVLGLKLIIAKD